MGEFLWPSTYFLYVIHLLRNMLSSIEEFCHNWKKKDQKIPILDKAATMRLIEHQFWNHYGLGKYHLESCGKIVDMLLISLYWMEPRWPSITRFPSKFNFNWNFPSLNLFGITFFFFLLATVNIVVSRKPFFKRRYSFSELLDALRRISIPFRSGVSKKLSYYVFTRILIHWFIELYRNRVFFRKKVGACQNWIHFIRKKNGKRISSQPEMNMKEKPFYFRFFQWFGKFLFVNERFQLRIRIQIAICIHFWQFFFPLFFSNIILDDSFSFKCILFRFSSIRVWFGLVCFGSVVIIVSNLPNNIILLCIITNFSADHRNGRKKKRMKKNKKENCRKSCLSHRSEKTKTLNK